MPYIMKKQNHFQEKSIKNVVFFLILALFIGPFDQPIAYIWKEKNIPIWGSKRTLSEHHDATNEIYVMSSGIPVLLLDKYHKYVMLKV